MLIFLRLKYLARERFRVLKEEISPATILDDALPEIIRFARLVETRRLGRFGISLQQLFAISILAIQGDCMMKEIGQELDLSLGAVTGIIDKLEEKGLVRRYTVRSDRRIVKAKLTEKGKKLFNEIRKDRIETLEEAMHGISKGEARVFVDVLVKLLQFYEKVVGDSSEKVVVRATKEGA